MVKAIRQLRRYANQRGSIQPEGNERLFHTSQFVVATCFEKALAQIIHVGRSLAWDSRWARVVDLDFGVRV
jgi:hypothetical protein